MDICSEIIEEELAREEAEMDMDMDVEEIGTPFEINLQKPEKLKAFLDEYVIGQDEAKRYYPLQFIIITNGFLRMRS